MPSFALLVDERGFYDYHHTQADTFDKVKPRELAEDAAAIALLAYALASSDEVLPRAQARR